MVGSLNRTPARMFMMRQGLSGIRLLWSLFEAEYVSGGKGGGEGGVWVFCGGVLSLFWFLFD